MDKKSIRFCAGGLMLLIATILNILRPLINYVISMITIGSSSSIVESMVIGTISTVLGNVISYAPLVIFTIFLLLKMRGTPIMVMSIILLIFDVLGLVLSVIAAIAATITNSGSYTFNFASPILIVVYALLLALSVSTRKPKPGSFAKLWFLPGIAYCVHFVAYIAYLALYYINLMPGADMKLILPAFGSSLLPYIPTMTLYCIGYFLAGHWLANPYKKGFTPAQPQTPYYPQGQ